MKHSSAKGFTLIELLIAMSLLAVILVSLFTALKSVGRTEIGVDQRLQKLDELRSARLFLQQTLGRVSASLVDVPGAVGGQMATFSAGSESLIWVGILPVRPNVGGRYFFRLEIEDGQIGKNIVIRFFPWSLNSTPAGWSEADARVLVSGVTSLKIQAQALRPNDFNGGAKAWPVGWQNGWPVTDKIPDQVRIGFDDMQGSWHEWTISIFSLPQGDTSFNSIASGPSRR